MAAPARSPGRGPPSGEGQEVVTILGDDMARLLLLVTTVCVTGIVAAGLARPQDPKSGAVPAKGAPGAEGKPIPIWPGVAPGSEGWTQKEVESRGGSETTVRNVTTPTLSA